jgi:hypothetical protein
VSGEYHYHRLLSQPALIHIARIGPLTPASGRTLTEPVTMQGTFLTWNLLGLGGLFLAAGSWVLGRQSYERITSSRRAALDASSPANQALQQLQDIENLLLEERQHEIPGLISEVLRRFLAPMSTGSPFTKPTAELLQDLPDGPYRKDIALLLRDCDVMKFGGRPSTRKESQELLQRAVTLIQRVAPPEAGGGDDGTR